MTNYYALTHPSEPNYVAAVGGDFFGMADDRVYNIPTKSVTSSSVHTFFSHFTHSMSTIVDLLEQKNIPWASYQENMPSDGFTGDAYGP